MLRQFVILLLCPPSPFVNCLEYPCTFAKELLNQEGQQRQIVASILAASRQDIAQMVFDLNLLQIELTEMPEKLEHALTFWSNVSQELTVRKRL